MDQWLIRNLQKMDQFGTQYVTRIQYNNKNHKTVLGGLATIIIYGLSLSYFAHEMIQWITNQTLPKVTITNYLLDEYTYNVQGMLAEIFITPQGDQSPIDPFDQNNMIFMSLEGVVQDGKINNSLTKFLPPNGLSIYNRSSVIFQNQSLTINTHHTHNMSTINYIILIELCNQNYLNQNNLTQYKCANSTTVNEYFKQPINVLSFSTQIQQYDVNNKKMQTILKTTSLGIESQSTQFITTYLNTGKHFIDTGILLQDISEQVVICDIESIHQTMSQNYFSSYTQNNPVYAVLDFELDHIQTQHHIEFQKISQTLADIGSIASFLFMFQLFCHLYAENELDEAIQKQVIEIYIPEMKNIEFKKNMIGQTKSVFNKVDQTEYDTTTFMEYYNKLRQIAQQKLTVINQIYEISRLQLILQSNSIFNDQLRELGGKLQNKNNQTMTIEESSPQIVKKCAEKLNIVQTTAQEISINQQIKNTNISLDQIYPHEEFTLLMMANEDVKSDKRKDTAPKQQQPLQLFKIENI